MIEASYYSYIEEALAYLLEYGLSNRYSFGAIEEIIVKSSLISGLEDNDFNASLIPEDYVAQAYGVEKVGRLDLSYETLFYAQGYLDLFFRFRKSFGYLFLYLPLEYFVEHYDAFHEMDISKLEDHFMEATKKTPLLKKLLESRDIKLTELSILCDINIHSLHKYVQKDEHLYKASFATIYALYKALRVSPNIFVPNLYVFLDNGAFRFDQEDVAYRNRLGLLFAAYFDPCIQKDHYQYDAKNGCILTRKGKLNIKVLIEDYSSYDLETLKAAGDKDTYLILYDYSFGDHNWDELKPLGDLGYAEVFLIGQEYVYILGKKRKKFISATVYQMLVAQAKASLDK